jgi:hypothetical protein
MGGNRIEEDELLPVVASPPQRALEYAPGWSIRPQRFPPVLRLVLTQSLGEH